MGGCIISLSLFAEDTKGLIRVYCSYLPKEKLEQGLEPQQQLKALVNEKLMSGNESVKVDAYSRARDYALDEKEYFALFDKCQNLIKDKGQLFNLKATNANKFESITFYYPITALYKDDVVTIGADGLPNKVLPLDDPQVLKGLNLTPEQEEMLTNNSTQWIKQNPSLIKKLATTVLDPLSQAGSAISGLPYAKQTLTVATILAAAWFGPAYVAGAVDLLYPIVYSVLFGGVPSKLGLSYWLVYYPGKVHAVVWAYNNASWIISLAGGAAALLQAYVMPNLGAFSRTK